MSIPEEKAKVMNSASEPQRGALRTARKALIYALPYLQIDESGSGPDVTPVLQALIDIDGALAGSHQSDEEQG